MRGGSLRLSLVKLKAGLFGPTLASMQPMNKRIIQLLISTVFDSVMMLSRLKKLRVGRDAPPPSLTLSGYNDQESEAESVQSGRSHSGRKWSIHRPRPDARTTIVVQDFP